MKNDWEIRNKYTMSYISDCHTARVEEKMTRSGTIYYECAKCKEPCDAKPKRQIKIDE